MPPVTSLDPDLVSILACPACRAGLAVNDAVTELTCAGCGRMYPVRDGVPVLLVDHSRPAAPAAHQPTTDRHDD